MTGLARKPLVAQCGADRCRDLPQVVVAAVRPARPGKVVAEEAIVVATRHDVNVEVRHALADDIVDRHERAVSIGSLRHGACQTSREGEE